MVLKHVGGVANGERLVRQIGVGNGAVMLSVGVSKFVAPVCAYHAIVASVLLSL